MAGMWKRIFVIAKKEFKSNIKNKWIILFVLIFFGLTVLVSFYGSSKGDDEWRNLEQTILWMSTYMEYMIPILGVILGYGSIVREKEKGSLQLVLSYPVQRGEVLSGKFLGLWGVFTVCVTSGLTLGGLIIGSKVSFLFWSDYYLFILASVILGGVYISIALMLSVIFEDSMSAMSSSVFVLFLFSFLWLGMMYALAEATFGWSSMKTGSPPRWYFSLQLLNPTLIWFTLLALNIPPFRAWALEFGGEKPVGTPSFYDTWVMIGILVIWIAIPLLVGEYILKRKDIY
ncbi:MAG: ABC transporter permease [Thermoplasmatota archaeon]